MHDAAVRRYLLNLRVPVHPSATMCFVVLVWCMEINDGRYVFIPFNTLDFYFVR